MTVAEVLTEAFRKAIASGWQVGSQNPKYGIKEVKSVEYFPESKSVHTHSLGGLSGDQPSVYATYLEKVIFSHDFAKAIWGEEYYYDPVAPPQYLYVLSKIPKGAIPVWQRHLQLMVIADDPIKYLEEHI